MLRAGIQSLCIMHIPWATRTVRAVAASNCFCVYCRCPPELLLGHKCTLSSDIYSYGVVLWEIVTGEQPVRGQMRDVR